MAKKSTASEKVNHDRAVKALRAHGLTYPNAATKPPWPGHLDVAVNDKIFVHLSVEGEPLRMSCKLPQSNAMALNFPFASPTGYGLGRSGWVTAAFALDQDVPVALLKEWIDESYRAIAPKRLVAALDGTRGAAPPPTKTKRRAARGAAKKNVGEITARANPRKRSSRA